MRLFADFRYYIDYAFYNRSSNIGIFRHEHDFSGYAIVAKVLNHKMYIPAFMSDEVTQLIRKEGYLRNSDIVCDISSIFRKVKAATTSGIFRALFTYGRNVNFTEVDTKKGYKYNGTTGVILDENYRPLMICCNIYDIVDESIKYCGPVCFISPRVFDNNDIISKFIVKSFIPNINSIIINNFKLSILISNDIDNFVNIPKVPINTDFNDDIYRILETHINEIIDEPQGVLQGLDESDTL